MDQVSPVLGLKIDSVESCNWNSCESSPQPSHTSSVDHINASISSSHSGNDQEPPHTQVYSLIDVEGPPSEAGCSFGDDVTPRTERIHDIMQDEEPTLTIACTEDELGRSLDVTGGGEPLTKKAKHSISTIDSFESSSSNDTNQIIKEQPPVVMSKQEVVRARSPLPAFGTILAPEQIDLNIMVALEGAELWHQFYQVGTEMIITKTGRRMFPGIVISVSGLDPDSKYQLSLEVNPADNYRYKYINTEWVNIGKAEAHVEDMLTYIHPESPSSGRHWMSSKVSFKKIKVSNNKHNKRAQGQVVALNSMQKYQPRVVISRYINKKNTVAVFTQELVECSFIAVTAYQNDHVTQLKIDHNPFAKAFRENTGETEGYGYGMMGAWPPISPLLSPYAPNYSADHQAMNPGMLSPAVPSPLPQFNTAFGNWESPPYSPSTYRPQMPGSGSLMSPSGHPMYHDAIHRQIMYTANRHAAQDSPPISPLLYSPRMHHNGHTANGLPTPSNVNPSIYQFPNVATASISHQLDRSSSMLNGNASSGATAVSTTYQMSRPPVGLGASPAFGVNVNQHGGAAAGNTLKGPIIPHQASAFVVSKIEPSHSPINNGYPSTD